MKHFFNYKIIFPNGKHYIGLSTTSKEQRTKEHKYCAKTGDTKYLYNALRKYNMVETFELIVIDTAETLEELCEKEKEYIIKYNSYYKNGKGYNMTYGGEGSFGYVFTDEAKLKNSEIRKKYFKDNPFAGKQHSIIMKKYYEDNANARKVMSELKKKHYEKPEVRKKHSEAQKKKYIDDPYNKKKKSDTMGQNKQFEIYKDGIFINTFNYQFEAKEYLQKEYQITTTIKIGEVLAKKRKSSAGFVFKYNEN